MANNIRKLPAYPLFLKDPYFSVWSAGDELAKTETSFWTGKERKTYGIIEVDGKSYCFLGNAKNVEKLMQTDVTITTFRTIYTFAHKAFNLTVSFFSPLPANHCEILACPVCYLEYNVEPKKELKEVKISLSLHQEWCYNDMGNTEMRGDVMAFENMDVAYFGLNRQHVFNKTADKYGADWGYYYLAAQKCYYHPIKDFNSITEYDNASKKEGVKYITAQNEYTDVKKEVNGKISVAFDDIVSINYYGEMLRGYYFKDGKTIIDAIKYSVNSYDEICRICADIEKDIAQNTRTYGEQYEAVVNASYRQVMAAHKLVEDRKGRLLFLSKECGSCGCIATVDVTYPTMPMLAYCNPELLRASVEPIFDFAKMDAWEYGFAPHDAGMYPFCNGQYYGVYDKIEGRYCRTLNYYNGLNGGKDVLPQYYLYPKGSNLYDYDRQMPVEECGNMILICAFYMVCGGDTQWIKAQIPALTKWCDYLIHKGLIPENQLCTDDFLERMDKNVNLAIKSVVAIGAFGKMLAFLGQDGSMYMQVAKTRAREIETYFKDRHMPFTFDSSEETFSAKYNLVPDKLLGLNLFQIETLEREVDTCLKNSCEYGIPLDHRTKMSKTDWTMWMAAVTDVEEKYKKIIKLVHNLLVKGPDRMPFIDWIGDAETGASKQFVNRTVQGSMFILLLKDKLAEK